MTIEQGTQDWNGRTVRGRDGGRLGRLTEVYPGERWGVVRSPLGMRRLVPLDGAEADGDRIVRVAADRASLRTAPDVAPGAPDAATETALRQHYTGRGVLADARAHQRQRFGGAKLGAAFFGWLVAVGVTVLLTGLLGGVAAALGSSTAVPPDASVTDAASVGVAIAALAVLVVAYFTGGYVAGRLARFDGSRNGFLSWVIGMLMTVAAVVVAAVAGSRDGALAQLRLPALPVSLEGLTVGTFVTLAVVVLGTLAAAVLGGAAGERFHSRVDRAATDIV